MSITLKKDALTKYKVPVIGLANRFDGDKFMLKLAFTCQMLNRLVHGLEEK